MRKKTIYHLKRILLKNLITLQLKLIRIIFSSNSEKFIRKEEGQEGLLQKIVMILRISINLMLKLRRPQAISVEEERQF
jgi:hypothetical protein